MLNVNVYNRQGTADVDDVYAPQFSLRQGGKGGTEQNANPVSGGTYEDLIWVKVIDRDGNVLGRIEGAAEWDSPKILGVLEPLLSGDGVVKASSR